jgi:hypothetical protein
MPSLTSLFHLLPAPSPAQTLYYDIVWIDAIHTAVSKRSKASLSQGKIADITI